MFCHTEVLKRAAGVQGDAAIDVSGMLCETSLLFSLKTVALKKTGDRAGSIRAMMFWFSLGLTAMDRIRNEYII